MMNKQPVEDTFSSVAPGIPAATAANVAETPRPPLAPQSTRPDTSRSTVRPAPFASNDGLATPSRAGAKVNEKEVALEALQNLAQQRGVPDEDALQSFFRAADRSRKGWLSYADFKRGVLDTLHANLSDESLGKLIAKIDVKSEGRIEFAQLQSFFAAASEPAPAAAVQPQFSDDEDYYDDEEPAAAAAAAEQESRPDTTASRARDSNPITGAGMDASPYNTGRKLLSRASVVNPITGVSTDAGETLGSARGKKMFGRDGVYNPITGAFK
eukprot:TRINITY_DN1069_c0_g1_i2.p1 TRINITY_DN1069_c0_g1~~TRINITY_DN1069_c0_g1_i2.p1  ORF type:complete len:270 (-),score=80.64 TRINITY_DN1069_c0_g1_i2:23-832(-)